MSTMNEILKTEGYLKEIYSVLSLKQVAMPTEKNLKNVASTIETIPIGGDVETLERILPLEYIESTGTQYINTGFVANQDTSVEIEFTPLSTNTFGIFTDMESKTSRAFNLLIVNEQFRFDYNQTSTLIATPTVVVGERYKIKLDKGTGYINNNQVYTSTYGTFTTPREMILFAAAYGNEDVGIETNLSAFAEIRLNSYKIWDKDTLVRDFRPCYREANNEVGLFDIVEGKFYPNLGTGEFMAG